MRLTPPTNNVFFWSVALAILGTMLIFMKLAGFGYYLVGMFMTYAAYLLLILGITRDGF